MNSQHLSRGHGGTGFMMGIVLLIVFFLVLVYFGLPMIQGGGTGGPSMNTPGTVNVYPK
jgi:hypothetical protein